jgi:hypothetical protein
MAGAVIASMLLEAIGATWHTSKKDVEAKASLKWDERLKSIEALAQRVMLAHADVMKRIKGW